MVNKKAILLVFLATIFYAGRAPALQVDPTNYAFASYLGAGIYRTAGQTVQVYLFPFSYTAKDMEPEQWGLKINLPVTFGFADFKFQDIVNTGLPDEVATGSFVPGVEYFYPVNANWTVIPFIDAGIARNFTTDETVNVYSGGIKHRLIFNHGNKQYTIGNKLLYAAHTGEVVDDSDDFASFETGLAMQFPLALKLLHRQLDFSLYYVNYRYYDDLEFLRAGSKLIQVEIQNEFGFTFGVRKFSELNWMDLPRLGLGYRYGDSLSIWRIVLGVPF